MEEGEIAAVKMSNFTFCHNVLSKLFKSVNSHISVFVYSFYESRERLIDHTVFNSFSDDNILDWSKFNQIADDSIKCIQNEKNKCHLG